MLTASPKSLLLVHPSCFLTEGPFVSLGGRRASLTPCKLSWADLLVQNNDFLFG